MVSPRARRQVAQAACARGLSLRRAAWLCTTARSGMRYQSKRPKRDARLAQALRGVAKRYPQWGYRLAEGFLRRRGWRVNLKRVHRLWRQCGLQVPPRKRQRKIRTGATLQPTAQTKNAVWSWDFVHDVTTDGHAFRCLTVKDEKTRWCVAIEVARSFSHERVIEVLTRLIAQYGCPQYIRSDNGPELVADALLKFFHEQGITPSRITPGKPWQNGSNESFNGTFRRECLDAERFQNLTEARVVIEDWRQHYNQERPHSALGYQMPTTFYWEDPNRKPITAEGATGAGENSTHTTGHHATFVGAHDREVGEHPGSVTTTEAMGYDNSENLTF
ncbi:MAG: IS3 family transposase [Nitrospirales bacterium]